MCECLLFIYHSCLTWAKKEQYSMVLLDRTLWHCRQLFIHIICISFPCRLDSLKRKLLNTYPDSLSFSLNNNNRMLGQVANAHTAAPDTMANAWLRIMTAMDTDESELGSDSDHELSILTSYSTSINYQSNTLETTMAPVLLMMYQNHRAKIHSRADSACIKSYPYV